MCFLTILDLKKHKRKMDYWVQSLLTPFWGFNFKLLYHYLIATAAYYAKISHVDQVPFPFYAHTPLHPKPKSWTPIHLKLLSVKMHSFMVTAIWCEDDDLQAIIMWPPSFIDMIKSMRHPLLLKHFVSFFAYVERFTTPKISVFFTMCI